MTIESKPSAAETADQACCSPEAPSRSRMSAQRPATANVIGGRERAADMALIPGGPFRYGCDRREGHPGDGEGPSRIVDLPAFRIDRCAVTNARFQSFVAATGYVTDAERAGWSFVFAGLLPDDFAETRGVAAAPWWREVFGACWHRPEGPHATISARADHPVVHVSHADALAFCAWAGKRLPTEVEWEKAARGGIDGQRFPWGDEEAPGGVAHCNVWQGVFPARNDLTDGFYGTAPADSYTANAFGLHCMAGNTWEWCMDWSSRRRHAALPSGPPDGELRVMRGGSYLCHPSYCWRYRNAARSASTPDSTTGHIGFRCAADA